MILYTPGPRDSPYRVGSGSGTEPLDFGSSGPVPDPRDTTIFHFTLSEQTHQMSQGRRVDMPEGNIYPWPFAC